MALDLTHEHHLQLVGVSFSPPTFFQYLSILYADVIVYIFSHLHTALRTEGNMIDMN